MATKEKKSDENKLTEIEIVQSDRRRVSVSSSINSSTASVRRRLAFLWRCCKCCFCVPYKCCRCCCCHKNRCCCGFCCHEYYHRKIQTDGLGFGSGSVYLKVGSEVETTDPLKRPFDIDSMAKKESEVWCLIVSECISPLWQKEANEMGMEQFINKFSDSVLKRKTQVKETMSPAYDGLEKLLKGKKNDRQITTEKELQILISTLESKLKNESDQQSKEDAIRSKEASSNFSGKPLRPTELQPTEVKVEVKSFESSFMRPAKSPVDKDEPLKSTSNRNSLLRKDFFGLPESDDEGPEYESYAKNETALGPYSPIKSSENSPEKEKVSSPKKETPNSPMKEITSPISNNARLLVGSSPPKYKGFGSTAEFNYTKVPITEPKEPTNLDAKVATTTVSVTEKKLKLAAESQSEKREPLVSEKKEEPSLSSVKVEMVSSGKKAELPVDVNEVAKPNVEAAVNGSASVNQRKEAVFVSRIQQTLGSDEGEKGKEDEDEEGSSGSEFETGSSSSEEESETITTKKITRIIRVDPNGERKEFVYEGQEGDDTEKLIEKALADSPYGHTDGHDANGGMEPVVKTQRRVVLKKEVVKRTVIQDGDTEETTTVETKNEEVSDSGNQLGPGGQKDSTTDKIIQQLEREFAEM